MQLVLLKVMVDYIIMQQEDKAKVRNVKVIPNEESVPKQECMYGSSMRKIHVKNTNAW